MNFLNFIIEFLNTEAGAALAMAVAGWLAMYVPQKNRDQVDRAAQIAVHFVEQMKRRGTIATGDQAKAAALDAAKASLPFAVRLMTKNETLERAIEAVIGMNNAGRSDQAGSGQQP